MEKHCYVIQIYDSTDLRYERKIPVGQIGRRQIEALIKTLAAKHGLTDEEIVVSYLKPNTRAHKSLLKIRQDSQAERLLLMCGDNPHILLFIERDSLA